MNCYMDTHCPHNKFSLYFLCFAKKTLELLPLFYDIIYSIPAKPLLQSTLNHGGFLLLWGGER